MGTVEIYFSDLLPEKQNELLKAAAVECPEDMNWDTFAVTVVNLEQEDEEENV